MLDMLSSGRWVTQARIRAVSAMMLAGTSGVMLFLFIGAHGSVDMFGRPLGTDFSNVWAAGWMANHGEAAQAWNWPAHYRVQQWAHGRPDIPFYGWHYPPPFLMIASLLARLPYVPALIAWQLSTLMLLLLLIRRIVPGRDAMLAALGCPVVLICLGHGHNGFLTAALIGGGMLLLDRRPWLAGLLLGCLVYKPQFALLIPPVLIVTGNWRALLGAAVASTALCTLTFALWGWPVWQAFIDSLPLTRHIVIEQGSTGWEKIQSAFSAIRMWGGPVPLAYAVQTLMTGAAIFAALFASRRGSRAPRGAAVLAAALLSTPYVLDYDFVVLGAAIAFMAADMRERGPLPWEASLLAFAWAAPLFGRGIAMLTLVPLDLMAAIAVLMLAVRRAIRLDGAPVGIRSWPFRHLRAASDR